MNRWKSAVLLLVAVLLSSLVIAQESTTQPSDGADRPRSRGRLTKPWSDLTTLTEEQRDKIIQIHVDARDSIKQIEQKEEDDIMAVLTEEQKMELEEIAAKKKALEKERRAAKKAQKDGGSTDDEKDK